jgi:tungstate transport system substrate-binding protein
MLEASQADVVLSHAPEQETATLQRHPSWFYRKVLYNDFVIVGPARDPAGIKSLTDAVQAMNRIVASGQRFVSRGDESGTHERERQLWNFAGVVPPTDQVIVAGAAMGQTLRVASGVGAYTLTDRSTFEALRGSIELSILVEGDPRLLNTYAVVADPAKHRGLLFARWLAGGEGRKVLEQLIRRGDVRAFNLWPLDRDATRPESRPF